MTPEVRLPFSHLSTSYLHTPVLFAAKIGVPRHDERPGEQALGLPICSLESPTYDWLIICCLRFITSLLYAVLDQLTIFPLFFSLSLSRSAIQCVRGVNFVSVCLSVMIRYSGFMVTGKWSLYTMYLLYHSHRRLNGCHCVRDIQSRQHRSRPVGSEFQYPSWL
jgi:hypothetical protein